MTDFLIFKKDKKQENILGLAELQKAYKFEADGTNYYIGINNITADSFRTTHRGLMDKHQKFFKEVLEFLAKSAKDHKTIVLGLEPPSKRDFMADMPHLESPYEYVKRHLDMIGAMARELAEFQLQASRSGKELRIFIRYASEMNDRQSANLYAGLPQEYKDSFRQVRAIFQQLAPQIRFSFSPALRADLMNLPIGISQYWPGDDVVDVAAATWYSGNDTQLRAAKTHLDFYLEGFKEHGKPFAIDEMGGRKVDPKGLPQIDAVLVDMLQHLATHQPAQGFAYVTAFAEGKWGAEDPKLPEPGQEPKLTPLPGLVAALPAPQLVATVPHPVPLTAVAAAIPLMAATVPGVGGTFGVKVITAESWGAIPKGPFARTQPQFIVIHHTDSNNPPNHSSRGGLDGCKQFARSIQLSHLARGFSDSGHNFLNTVDGTVLEGRHGSLRAVEQGFCVQSAHAAQDPPKLAGGNQSPGIENEGNFMKQDMQEPQWSRLVELCAAICRSCHLSPSSIRGHREFSDTDCPGDRLFAKLPQLRKEIADKLGVVLEEHELANAVPGMLKLGSRGDDVLKLQQRLREVGHSPGAPDGIFGENTRAAVVAFQRANGLTDDGVVGPMTLRKLQLDLGGQLVAAER